MTSVVVDEKKTPWRFGGFTLNPEHHALFCNQERLHITEKPLETLIFLVENRGRVVEKQELLDAVWTGTFVTEDTLVHAVREIRRVLKDDKDNPRFIQTVPRQGYRFVGEVFAEINSKEANAEELAFAPIAADFPERFPPSKSAIKFGNIFLLGLAGLLIVAAIAVGFIYFYKQPPRAKALYETQKQLTAGEFSAGKPAFSPDGKLMLCVWSSPETRGFGDIFVVSVADNRSIPITTKENPSGDLPTFTSDSNYVVYSRYRSGSAGDRLPDLYIVPSSGLTAPRVYIAEASGAGFSPDGKYVAYTKHLPSQKSLWLSPTGDLAGHFEIAPEGYTPRFAPDGKWLAYTTSNPERGLGDLWVVDTATFTERRNLTRELQQLYGLTWTADSRSIIFSSKRSGIHLLWQVSLDDAEIKPLMPTFGGYAIAPSVAADGKTLVFQYGRIAKDLLLTKTGNEQTENLTTDELHEWVRFSPSGKQIASVVQRHDFGKDISIIELGGSVSDRKARRFALSDKNPESLCWLDEKRIAYLTQDAKTTQTKAVVVNTGNGMATPLTAFAGTAEWLAVRPDGKTVAVVLTDADKKQKIVLRNLETQADETIAEGGEYAALHWLPDGSALSWSGPIRSTDSKSGGIWLWSKEQSEPVRVVSDGFNPVWSKDKSTLYYSKMGGMIGLWQKKEKEEPLRGWADNVVYFDVSDEKIVFIQAKEIVKAQIYSVELER